MDREYDGLQVARSLTHRDVTFLAPLTSRRQHQEYHIEAMDRMGKHVDVERLQRPSKLAGLCYRRRIVLSSTRRPTTTAFLDSCG
jgi:NAD(P)H-hydrate repair Nnr-like enzyme with NAD(P)H-hydrate epimerase domain